MRYLKDGLAYYEGHAIKDFGTLAGLFGRARIDMDAKNDIKTQYWYLFLYGVSFVAFLMSSIKRALLTKLFILAISL